LPTGLYAVVVLWARARNRYERQGLLVEAEALAQAEAKCLSDAEVRARRWEREAIRRDAADSAYIAAFAASVRAEFPGRGEEAAAEIATHACARHSNRVGRTAAAKEFAPGAVRLAVGAHVRHVHTPYDRLPVRYGIACEQVYNQVEQILRDWRQT
jgi:hypothetical protein